MGNAAILAIEWHYRLASYRKFVAYNVMVHAVIEYRELAVWSRSTGVMMLSTVRML